MHYLEVPQGAAKLIKKLRSCVRWGGAHVEVTHHDHISLPRQTLEVLNEGGNGGLVGFVEVSVDKVSRELEGLMKEQRVERKTGDSKHSSEEASRGVAVHSPAERPEPWE